MSLTDEFKIRLAESFRSRTLTTCSRWAEYRRIMGGDFPGPMKFDKWPWSREIHDAQASLIAVMKAAQMALTESAVNRALYTVIERRKNVLYVLPTQHNASDFSQARFGPALILSPYLAGSFTKTNNIGLKQAGGVTLYIRGSKSKANLRSLDVADVILDELDVMDRQQVWASTERSSGHLDTSLFAISTPTVPNHGIHLLYQQGSQEHWFFPCPHCKQRVELTWPDCIQICGDHVNDPRVHESYLKCPKCQKKLEQENKPEYLTLGKWEPTVQDFDPEARSFYINQLYSFTVNAAKIVNMYLRSQTDVAAAVEFYNQKIGIPYIPDGSQITDALIEAVIRQYSKNEIFKLGKNRRLITMGVDIGNLLHIVICEWFIKDIGKDLNVTAQCKVLWCGTRLKNEFEQLDKLMRQYQVLHCVIDPEPNFNDTIRFARRFLGFVTPCWYRTGPQGKEITTSTDEQGVNIIIVNRTNWIDAALNRFHTPDRIILPCDIDLEFKDHLKNIIRTYRKDKNNNDEAYYVTPGHLGDHYAHALTYAEIALPLASSHVYSKPIGAFL